MNTKRDTSDAPIMSFTVGAPEYRLRTTGTVSDDAFTVEIRDPKASIQEATERGDRVGLLAAVVVEMATMLKHLEQEDTPEGRRKWKRRLKRREDRRLRAMETPETNEPPSERGNAMSTQFYVVTRDLQSGEETVTKPNWSETVAVDYAERWVEEYCDVDDRWSEKLSGGDYYVRRIMPDGSRFEPLIHVMVGEEDVETDQDAETCYAER